MPAIFSRLGVSVMSAGTAVGKPVFESVRAEQRKKRHGDHARLVDRDMRYRRLRPLRQQNADAVAYLDALGIEQIGEPIGQLRYVAEGIARRVAAFCRIDKR